MKMVTIYVDEVEWQGLQKRVLQLSAEGGVKISNGRYLMDLHKSVSRSAKRNLGPLKEKYSRQPQLEKEVVQPDPADNVSNQTKGYMKVLKDNSRPAAKKRKPGPVEQAGRDLEKVTTKPKKEPKRTPHGNCVDCGALSGHRAGCV